MSIVDPAQGTAASLGALRAALDAAGAAPAQSGAFEEDENADIATPRAKAASILESALKARLEWHWDRDERVGEQLCRALIDMCAWHEHASLRDRILNLQGRGIALLAANPGGQPGAGDVGEIEDEYQAIKPREDDAAAIAAALGMTVEEARAFGLVGTLSGIGFDDEAPMAVPVAAGMEEAPPDAEEDLETLFRREALNMVTRTLPQALQRFWGTQQSMDAMLAVRRGFHTLKGDARVTAQSVEPPTDEELEGLAVLSEAAEDIIDYLIGDDYDREQPAPPLPPGAFSVLNETVSALARRLDERAPLQGEAALLRRLEGMQRKAAAQSGVPIDEATLAAKLPPPPTRRLVIPTRKHTGAGPVPRPAPHSLLPTFLDEADRLMPDLHRALATLSTNPADDAALVRARVKLHTLKGGAALIGEEAQEIQKIAHSAEDLFELIEDFQLRGEMQEVPKVVLDGVLDAEDALQSLVDVLRRQGRSGRLPVSPLLPIPPEVLANRLDEIAERVRRGDLGRTRVEIPPAEAPAAEQPPPAGKGEAAPPDAPEAVEPAAAESAPLLHRVLVPPPPRKPVETAIGLREISFRDQVERSDKAEIRSRTAILDRIRTLEDRARGATGPFTLFTCVQRLSHYVTEQARYRELVGEHGRIYVFGKLDALPAPVDRIIIVPLEEDDRLIAERLAILDMPEHGAAFFALDVAASSVDQGRRFLSLQTEDAITVRDAAARLRAALRQDASLVDVRRTGLAGGSGADLAPLPRLRSAGAARRRALPQERSRQAPEFGKDYSVKAALSALEDLSVNRDALQELVGSLTKQSIESRRSGARLRTLVERVGGELAGLRSELVRTTRRTGDWDLLEKEEYSTIDVLLMQLDEALADLEESDTNLRRDLAEARAQVEIQSDNQLRAQRALLDMSMIPLSQIEDRLNHAVRSQSRRLNRQVAFRLEGGDLLLDGRIAESLFEPLMHLINNALDHGIEEKSADRVAAGKTPEGHVTIRGRSGGDGVILEVIDDGRGIDPERIAAVAVSRGIVDASTAAEMSAEERIALIWRPGFSTARNVTAISGRGMGMKSVLDDIVSLQGSIAVNSVVGKGTIYTINLPRSLAMLRVEVVREGKDLVAVPISQVGATYPVRYSDLSESAGRQVQAGGRLLTVFGAHLANGPAGDGEAGQAILLEVPGRGGGIVVDDVVGSQYLPVRPAPDYLRRHCGLLGYAVGGGGRILPILDLPTLIDRAAANVPTMDDERERPAYSVLVVDDSQTMRRALRDTLTKAGFLVREAADGREALTTCTRAMPDLITLDMEMPGMDGLEALSALRLLANGGASVPVFMITSRQQARHRAAALAAGVTRYFTKPYDTDELIGAAQLVLAEGVRQQREVAS